MTARRLTPVLAAVLAATAALGADDPYGDPVPAGAKLRLGTARLRTPYGGPTAMTPDGKFLVGGAPGGGLAYTDPATGKVARTVRVEGVFGPPTAFSADGKRGVIGGYGEPVVFDAEAGKVLAKLPRSAPGGDHGAALSADGKRLAVGSSKGFDEKEKDKKLTALVWDVDANKQVSSVTAAQNGTVYVALSGDGSRLATWGYHYEPAPPKEPNPEREPARQIQFWDATTGKELAKVTLDSGYAPSTVALSPDGSLAAASAADGTVYLFDPATGKSKGQLLGRSRQGRKLAFSADGKSVASAGDDGYIQVWSAADGKRIATTKPPLPMPAAPQAIHFAGGDRVVAWGRRGLSLAVWEAPSGKLLSPAGGHADPVAGLAPAAGGKEFYTSDSNGLVLRWDATSGKELGRLELESAGGGYGYGRGMVLLSPDGRRALGSEGGGLAVYELPAGTQQFVIPGGLGRYTRGAFTADGGKVVQVVPGYDAKTSPARAVVWDAAAGKKLGEVTLPEIAEPGAALSPDGKTLVTAGLKRSEKGPGQVVVAGWELATGKKLGEYAEENQGFGPVQVAAAGDNKSAVVITPGGTAIVVAAAAGTKSRALELPNRRAAGTPVVSPDGKLVAVPTAPDFGPTPTYSVLLFEVESGKLKKSLDGLGGAPGAAAFSPDGKLLLTGSADTTALVWEVGGP